MGSYFSQMSVIYFCRGFSCCPYYRGVRNSEVSARRELTVIGSCQIHLANRDQLVHWQGNQYSGLFSWLIIIFQVQVDCTCHGGLIIS